MVEPEREVTMEMIRYSRRAKGLLPAALMLAAAACLGPGDITGDEEDVVPVGTIVVATTTTGASSDPNGYMALLNEGVSQPIEANGFVTFSPVPAGTYNVWLDGVDLCSVTTPNPVFVLVMPDSTVTTQFDVTCP